MFPGDPSRPVPSTPSLRPRRGTVAPKRPSPLPERVLVEIKDMALAGFSASATTRTVDALSESLLLRQGPTPPAPGPDKTRTRNRHYPHRNPIPPAPGSRRYYHQAPTPPAPGPDAARTRGPTPPAPVPAKTRTRDPTPPAPEPDTARTRDPSSPAPECGSQTLKTEKDRDFYRTDKGAPRTEDLVRRSGRHPQPVPRVRRSSVHVGQDVTTVPRHPSPLARSLLRHPPSRL